MSLADSPDLVDLLNLLFGVHVCTDSTLDGRFIQRPHWDSTWWTSPPSGLKQPEGYQLSNALFAHRVLSRAHDVRTCSA